MAPRSKVRLVAAGLVLGCGLASVPAQSAPPPPRWQPPVLISERQAARETSLAISPTNPRVMVVCAPSGVPSTGNGQSYFHRSVDGGATWASMNVETIATDTRKAAFEGGDCDVAADQGGTLYAADTWVGNLSVGASRDNGRTWSGTSVSVTSPIVDRPWLVGGPKGTVYLSYHDVQCCMPSAMWFTKSVDYGKTFAPSVPIPTPGPEGAYIWEGNFVVAPSGKDIYLVYSRRLAPLGVDTGMDLFLAASHDGGTTWTSTPVASTDRATTSIYPSIGLDGGGHLHVVYSAPAGDDDPASPVYYTTSKDRGARWSAPVGFAPGLTTYAPWVVGGKRAGEAAVAWLGSPTASDQWFFYWARTRLGSRGAVTISAGRTTAKPVYAGDDQIAPEFEMVALDNQGRMNVGMSVYRTDDAGRTAWALYFQRETAAPR